MSKEAKQYLRHILDECEYLIRVVENLEFDGFLEDETLKRAAVRSLEIIGEATKKIPIDVKLQWSGIPWKSMAGMRDRLIHDYIGVNYHIVWDVIKNKVPEMHARIQDILNPGRI